MASSWWSKFKTYLSARAMIRDGAPGAAGGDRDPSPATSTDRCPECGTTDPARHHPVCGVPRQHP